MLRALEVRDKESDGRYVREERISERWRGGYITLFYFSLVTFSVRISSKKKVIQSHSSSTISLLFPSFRFLCSFLSTPSTHYSPVISISGIFSCISSLIIYSLPHTSSVIISFLHLFHTLSSIIPSTPSLTS